MTNDLHWVEAPGAEENDVVATDRVKDIFADARAMQALALERLEQGDVRDAAERPGAPPSGPPTPWCWPEPAKSRNCRGRLHRNYGNSRGKTPPSASTI